MKKRLVIFLFLTLSCYFKSPGQACSSEINPNEKGPIIECEDTDNFDQSLSEIKDQKPSLLIEMATRSRPEQVLEYLEVYHEKLSGKYPCHVVIAIDKDDLSMNNEQVRSKLSDLNSYPKWSLNIQIIENFAETKIYAINSGYSEFFSENPDKRFDILITASDDMEPAIDGYDQIIVETMRDKFPDFDGVLNFGDGSKMPDLNTFQILGKKYYDRFGTLFSPKYKSDYADDEFTLVSRILGKEFVSPITLVNHYHHFFGLSEKDALYQRNDAHKVPDYFTYQERRHNNFDLDEDEIFEKDLSILTCTIKERESLFKKLRKEIERQILEAGLQEKVEYLFFLDKKGENSIAAKRNDLYRRAKGKYLVIVDDDDWIHEKYVEMIYNKLQSKPDFVAITGIITFDGNYPTKFKRSTEYDKGYSYVEGGVYLGPPNHITPIKNIIASQFLYKNVPWEDNVWSMELQGTGLLKTKETIEEPIYFYDSRTTKPEDETNILELKEQIQRDPFQIKTTLELAQALEKIENSKPEIIKKDYKAALTYYNIAVGLTRLELARMERDWSQALSIYLEAYEKLPELITPILEIAKHYVEERNPLLSYLFIRALSAIGNSDGKLFHTSERYNELESYEFINLITGSAVGCKECILSIKDLFEILPEDKNSHYGLELCKKCDSTKSVFNEEEYEKKLEEVKKIEAAGNWPKALTCYFELLTSDPTRPASKISKHYEIAGMERVANLFRNFV